MARRNEMIGPDQFRAMLETEFPGTLAKAAEAYGAGNLHVEVSTFRRTTIEAIDAGRLWLAERHFRFIASVWPRATADLENAIDISYVEEIALSEATPQRYAAVRERMPPEMRAKLIAMHDQWK
jgi:hypothetical protein